MSNKEKPMLVFNTSQPCEGCKRVRGPDGTLRDGQKFWNAEFIRGCLLGPNKKLKALRIINIHDSETYPSVDHICEFNLYHLIPSSVRVDNEFFEKLMDNPEMYVGDSILKVKLTRENDGSTGFYVDIDGNPEDSRCSQILGQVEEFFIWNYVPDEFSRLRSFFRGESREAINDILPDLRDDPFHDILVKEYNKYVVDPNYYEKQMKVRYGFSWFLDFFYPTRLRELEAYYPNWLIVLPSEWAKGLNDQELVREATLHKNDIPYLKPLFGKAVGCDTYMEGTRFRSQKTKNETVNDCLKQYYDGRLFLTYEEVLMNTNGSVVPAMKKFVNPTTGATYTIMSNFKK